VLVSYLVLTGSGKNLADTYENNLQFDAIQQDKTNVWEVLFRTFARFIENKKTGE
jgi:hypothetical protein